MTRVQYVIYVFCMVMKTGFSIMLRMYRSIHHISSLLVVTSVHCFSYFECDENTIHLSEDKKTQDTHVHVRINARSYMYIIISITHVLYVPLAVFSILTSPVY